MTEPRSGFQLTAYSSFYNCGDNPGVRTRIECEASIGLSPKVFAYVIKEGGTRFSHVCSAMNYREYPEDTPDPTSNKYWCRKEYVDYMSANPERAKTRLDEIVNDVTRLYGSIVAYDNIVGTKVFVIGDGIN